MTEESKGATLDPVMPKVRELTIGIRKYRTIKLYPLAVRPEMKVLRLIGDAWNKIAGIQVSVSPSADQPANQPSDQSADTEEHQAPAPKIAGMSQGQVAQKVVEALSDTMEETIGRILEIATCEEYTGEDLLDDMDNDQLLEAVEVILEVNFLGVMERGPIIAEKFRKVMEAKEQAPAPAPATKKKK